MGIFKNKAIKAPWIKLKATKMLKKNSKYKNKTWSEALEDGRKKDRCAGSGSAKEWEEKRERDKQKYENLKQGKN